MVYILPSLHSPICCSGNQKDSLQGADGLDPGPSLEPEWQDHCFHLRDGRTCTSRLLLWHPNSLDRPTSQRRTTWICLRQLVILFNESDLFCNVACYTLFWWCTVMFQIEVSYQNDSHFSNETCCLDILLHFG